MESLGYSEILMAWTIIVLTAQYTLRSSKEQKLGF